MPNRINPWFCSLLLLAIFSAAVCSTRAQGTAFTYNGSFNVGNTPAAGNYDLNFTLYDSITNGTSFGSVTNPGTSITNGLFSLALDFGNVFNGSNYWLELAVRTNGALQFTTLSPRQLVTPTPYAIYSPYAGTAGIANSVASTNITGPVPLAQLSAPVVTNLQNDVALAGGFTGFFTGNGAGLTNLPVTSLSGTIPDTQLSSNIMRLNLANSFVPATAAPVIVSGFLVGANILNGGTGYGTAPFVAVTDVSGSNAVITATVSNGVVVGLMVQAAGRAYSSGTILTIAPPPSTAYQTVSSGVVFNGTSFFNNPGNQFVGSFTGNGGGLTNLPLGGFTGEVPDSQLSGNIARLNLADTDLPATAGAVINSGYVTGAIITNGGSGYSIAPLVTVTDFTGSNAVITAGISNGAVTILTVQAVGSGYSPATTLTIAPPPDNSIQTFSSGLNFTGADSFSNPSNSFSGSYAGNGSNLTNVNAAALAGSIGLANLPGAAVTNGAAGITLIGPAFSSNSTNATGLAATFDGAVVGAYPGFPAWEIVQRLAVPSLSVPTLRPLNKGELAVDFMPNGSPGDNGYGIVWNDICAIDCITNNPAPVPCLHLSAHSGFMEISSVSYNSGIAKPLFLGYGPGQNDAVAIAITPSNGFVGIGTVNPTAPLSVAGAGVFSGKVTATSFIGDGSGLTNLTVNNFAGSLPDNLLSTNIARLNLSSPAVTATAGVTVVSGAVFAATITNGGSGYLIAPLVTISDATGSNAVITATITNGVVSGLTIKAAGSGYSANAALIIAPPPPSPNYQTFTSGNLFTGVNTFNNPSNNFGGTFWGNGCWLTNLNPASISNGTANINITGNAATATTAATVTGNIADTQLSANVPLLNAANTFTGGNTFAGPLAAVNFGNVVNGTFSGNGAGLTNVPATAISGGLTTNILIDGHIFFITNGLIINIQ